MSQKEIMELIDCCVGHDAIILYGTPNGGMGVTGRITGVDFPQKDKIELSINEDDKLLFKYENFECTKVDNNGVEFDLRTDGSEIYISLL